MTSNKFININEIIIDKILISDNGKYSKSVMTYKGTQTLDPSIIRAVIKVPVSLTMENYWEKVGENWYITILISTTHLSGNTLFHNTPNDKSTWQNTKFFEFNSPSLGFGSLVYQVKK